MASPCTLKDALIGLDGGEHGSGEITYLQRVLYADGNPSNIEQVQ